MSQTAYPHLTVSKGDTLAVFSLAQYKAVRFSIGYIRHLQKLDTLHVREVCNLDKQIHSRDSLIALERLKTLEKDSINVNLESVIKDYKKARRKEQTKKTMINLFKLEKHSLILIAKNWKSKTLPLKTSTSIKEKDC